MVKTVEDIKKLVGAPRNYGGCAYCTHCTCSLHMNLAVWHRTNSRGTC